MLKKYFKTLEELDLENLKNIKELDLKNVGKLF